MDETLKDFNKKFTELVKENTKLQHLKERYVEHAKVLMLLSERIDGLKTDIITLARSIDPVLSTGKKYNTRLTKDDYEEIFRPLLEKMREGTHITRKTLEQMYPDFAYHTIGNLMVKLSKLKGVQSAKDGAKLRLFI